MKINCTQFSESILQLKLSKQQKWLLYSGISHFMCKQLSWHIIILYVLVVPTYDQYSVYIGLLPAALLFIYIYRNTIIVRWQDFTTFNKCFALNARL